LSEQATTYFAATLGLIGVIVGAIITGILKITEEWLKQRAEKEKDEPRRQLLKRMLKDMRYEWRKLDTLSHVIGSDPETTKRLLIEIGTRASENGRDLWGLIEDHPLGNISE
jgi:Na+-translocating ferredoxin:NAD+ oxidoreductase RnfG subunit